MHAGPMCSTMSFMRSTELPFFMPVPVTVPFPCSPVLSYVMIGHSFMDHRAMPETNGNSDNGTRNSSNAGSNPWAIVSNGPVPSSAIRAIPVALIEKDISRNIRGIIYIGTRDDDERGWGRDYKRRQRHGYTYVYLCIRSNRRHHGECEKNQNYNDMSFHMDLLTLNC